MRVEKIKKDEMVLIWDQDGTLANIFEPGFLEKIFTKGFFLNLVPYENSIGTIKKIHKEYPHIKQYLCTILTPTPHCKKEKNLWMDNQIGDIIPPNRRIFVPYGKSKPDYIPGYLSKNIVFIDDYTKNCQELEEAGITVLKFKNNINCVHGKWRGKVVDGMATVDQLTQDILDAMG